MSTSQKSSSGKSSSGLTLEALCQQNRIGWVSADDALSLANLLADDIAVQLQSSIVKTGQASLVVSGGSTPAPVFAKLSQCDLDWSKVSITLADERWVPPGHADSNESLVRQTLMVNKAASASFVPLYREAMSTGQAIPVVERDIAGMASPFTVVILGMGGDGHTASLFPDAPEAELISAMELDNKQKVAVLNPPSVAQARMTLTRAALLNAQARIVHITGETKHKVLYDALMDTCKSTADGTSKLGAYAHGDKPIAGLVAHQPDTVSVYWSK